MNSRLAVMLGLFAVIPTSSFAADPAPDLFVKSGKANWTPPHKTAYATIYNVGKADCGPFTVYLDAEENPVSDNRRPQLQVKVNGLKAGQRIEIKESFISVQHPENANLANVKKICVKADPKDEIKESNESNNQYCYAVLP